MCFARPDHCPMCGHKPADPRNLLIVFLILLLVPTLLS